MNILFLKEGINYEESRFFTRGTGEDQGQTG